MISNYQAVTGGTLGGIVICIVGFELEQEQYIVNVGWLKT